MLATIVKYLLAHLVFLLMLSVGLAATVHDLRDLRRRPRLYARALLVMLIGVPLLAIVVVRLLHVHSTAAQLILILAVCPGAPFLPFATKGKGEAHSPVGLDLLLVVSVLNLIATPLWIALLSRISAVPLEITPMQVFAAIIPTVLLPLGLGFAIRRFLPRVVDPLAKVVHGAFLVALVIAAVVALYLGAPVVLEASPRVLAAVLLVVTGSAVMGYLAAAPDVEERRTVGVAAALGNPGLGLAVIAASYPNFKAAAFVLAYVLFRKLALIPFEQWAKHRGEHPTSHPPALTPRPLGT